MRLFPFLVPAILALSHLSCSGGPTDSAGSASISGQVRSVGSTSGLSGVTVEVAGATTTTTASGNYSLSNLPTGNVVLRASAAGFQDFSQSLVLENGPNHFDIDLTSDVENATLSGRVVNARDQGVPNATVSIAGFTTTTDDVGVFQFPQIPQGNHDLVASATNYLDRTLNLLIFQSDFSTTVRLQATAIDAPPIDAELVEPSGLTREVGWETDLPPTAEEVVIFRSGVGGEVVELGVVEPSEGTWLDSDVVEGEIEYSLRVRNIDEALGAASTTRIVGVGAFQAYDWVVECADGTEHSPANAIVLGRNTGCFHAYSDISVGTQLSVLSAQIEIHRDAGGGQCTWGIDHQRAVRLIFEDEGTMALRGFANDLPDIEEALPIGRWQKVSLLLQAGENPQGIRYARYRVFFGDEKVYDLTREGIDAVDRVGGEEGVAGGNNAQICQFRGFRAGGS